MTVERLFYTYLFVCPTKRFIRCSFLFIYSMGTGILISVIRTLVCALCMKANATWAGPPTLASQPRSVLVLLFICHKY